MAYGDKGVSIVSLRWRANEDDLFEQFAGISPMDLLIKAIHFHIDVLGLIVVDYQHEFSLKQFISSLQSLL